MVTILNSKNFAKETGKGFVLVDFWAEWCAPCQLMIPVFEEVSEDFKGKVKFCKLNVDEGSDIAEKFSVSGIPCLILLKDGKEIGRFVGFMSGDSLREKIESVVGKA